MSDTRTLLFHEKIPKSNTNSVLVVPSLNHENYILSSIDFTSDQYHFEVSVKCGSNDLVRLCTTYFKHSSNIDLSGHKAKIEEGDKIEMYVKPKQAPKDLDVMICYTYVKSLGSIYHQSSERIIDLQDSTCTVISDIAQTGRPTLLNIKSDVQLKSFALIPKFSNPDHEDDKKLKFEVEFSEPQDGYDLDFDNDNFREIIPLLRYYKIKVTTVDTSNQDAMIHFIARGFK
tara:strand:- start:4736 stop:5425 length:690 start_codon:yes stop_codon:yes gene_type:complete